MSAFPQNFGIGFAQLVWLFSGYTGYNTFRVIGYPAYLSLRQQGRLERMRQARMLHDGRHYDYFIYESRTQFDFPAMRSMDRELRPFVPYNMLKLISQKSADLLFGAEPSVRVENEVQSKAVEDLAERTALHKLLYNTAAESAYDGEAAIEAVIQDGRTYLKRIDAADLFPEGPIQPDGQYKSYVRYNARNRGTDQSPDWILLVTRYEAGRITRTVRQLDQGGAIVPRELTLNLWPQEDPESEPLEPETRTGIDRNTITWIPNLLVRDIAVSDYDGLVELQDLLNAKRTQIARVLSMHSDPNMAWPVEAARPDTGTIDSRYRVSFFTDPNMVPRYITWDPQLASAMADFLEVRSAMLLESETSPILLGIKDHATAHVAYKSVRLEATNSLTKAQRKAVIWRAAIKRMLGVAQDLEQTIPLTPRYAAQPVGVEMQDGLPIDTDQQASEIATLRSAGVLSVERSLEILIADPAARAREAAALEAERQSNLPTVFGEGAGQAPPVPREASQEASPAAAGAGEDEGEAAPTGAGIDD